MDVAISLFSYVVISLFRYFEGSGYQIFFYG